jgi:hypothetical protein
MQRTEPAKCRRVGAAEAFIDARLASGRVAFSLGELVERTGLSSIAAKNQLLRLGPQVVRVGPRQQFFLIVAPEHRALGAPPVLWWLQDYLGWTRRPYYLALQSAASAYGSNPQALQVTQVMTDLPRRDITIGRLRVVFYVKRRIPNSSTQPLANAFAPVTISTPETTAFDLVRYAARIGGVARAAETLASLLPLLRAVELRGVLDAEDEPTTAQRLGYLIEALGRAKLGNTVRCWLPARLPLVRLAPASARSRDAEINARWQILNNSGDAGLDLP